MGRYGPQVSITCFDSAPRELEWQLPLEGELYRLIPGPDRPDYSLLVLERPLHFYPPPSFDLTRVEADQRVEDRKGRPMVRVHALLVCARFVGQQLHPGMRDLAVNIAYVIDNSLARDALVDFAKIEVAAVGFLSEGHAGRPETPDGVMTSAAAGPVDPASSHISDETSDETSDPMADPVSDFISQPLSVERPAQSAGEVVAEASRALRDGIAAHRGRPVRRLTATLVVGSDHRLAGLSGNADGQPPVPTPDTFDRVNAVLARLGGHAPTSGTAPDRGERRFSVRMEGDSVITEEMADRLA